MIRSVNQTDAQRVAEIYNYYVADSIATFETEPVSANTMAARIALAQEQSMPWLVALDEQGQLIGFAYAGQWHKRSAYGRTIEITVYLSPSAMSQQVGSKLYQALFAELKKLGAHAVIGCISLPNAASVALHEKFGMVKVAHFAEVGHKFGKWIDVGYWQIIL